MPSLAGLRCFAVAARIENFSRAADELHLTHGAVSRAIRAIEDELGIALFERRSRRVFLTDAGRRLAQSVNQGFGLIDDTLRELRTPSRAAPLVVSCEPTLLMRWLIPRWPAFQARHPNMPVHLVAGGGPFRFGDGIDVAIRRNDFAWPASIHATPLFVERVGPVCSPAKADRFFRKTGKPGMRAGALRLKTTTRPGAWDAWSTQTGHALDNVPAQVFEHFYFSLQAAVAGLGMAIGPWHMVCDDIASGVLVAPLGFVEDGSTYYLLTPRESSAHSPQGHLLSWLREIAA
jgi:DNA-binding transcriptional LysR family regulator